MKETREETYRNMKPIEIFENLFEPLRLELGNDSWEFLMKRGEMFISQIQPVTAKTEQDDIDDLNQYIINLLFSAYSDGKQGVTLDVFDRWLEEQMDHIDDYLKSQNYGNTKKK